MSIEQQNESLKERLMAVEHEKFLLRQQVAKLNAQMKSIQNGTSNPHELSPPPESDFFDCHIKQEDHDYIYALPTPQQSFGAPSTSFPSPETATYSESSTPATMSLGLDALTAPPDMTQHPAAMLCDLQCQSVGTCPPSTPPTTHPPQTAATRPFTETPPLYPILISAIYSQLTYPLMTIFTFLKTASPLPPASSMNTPMVSLLIRWLISTPTDLLPRTASASTKHPTALTATKKSSRSLTPKVKKTLSPRATISAPPPTTAPPFRKIPILRPRLLRRLLLSSPSLARPLEAATGRALRLKTGVSRMDGNGVAERSVVRRVERRSHNRMAGLKAGGAMSKSRSVLRSRSRSRSRGQRRDLYQYAGRRECDRRRSWFLGVWRCRGCVPWIG